MPTVQHPSRDLSSPSTPDLVRNSAEVVGLTDTTGASPLPSDLVRNSTIETQLAHRTIRAYTDKAVDEDTLATLIEVARHAPSSSFYQSFTLIRIQDPAIREVVYRSSGQPYVGGDKGELFVFVVDLSRIARIREAAGLSLEPLERATLFIQGVEDTLLAAQNMVVAAESLGLGTCFLGSIGSDPDSLIKALKLPQYTYPLVGMLVGHPAQDPQLKPRLPREVTVSVDTYPDFTSQEYRALVADYDTTIQTYYDLREGGKRQDSYTTQMQVKPGMGGAEKTDLLRVLHDQGLCLR